MSKPLICFSLESETLRQTPFFLNAFFQQKNTFLLTKNSKKIFNFFCHLFCVAIKLLDLKNHVFQLKKIF